MKKLFLALMSLFFISQTALAIPFGDTVSCTNHMYRDAFFKLSAETGLVLQDSMIHGNHFYSVMHAYLQKKGYKQETIQTVKVSIPKIFVQECLSGKGFSRNCSGEMNATLTIEGDAKYPGGFSAPYTENISISGVYGFNGYINKMPYVSDPQPLFEVKHWIETQIDNQRLSINWDVFFYISAVDEWSSCKTTQGPFLK